MVFDDPGAAFARRSPRGARRWRAPEEKPHGQTVGWVSDPFGTLVEVCSPMG